MKRELGHTIGAGLNGAAPTARVNVAIVGAGRRGTEMLRLLREIENVNVVGVCDVNPRAPGLRIAEQMHVFTTEHHSELFQVPGLGLIVEVTDDPNLRSELSRTKPATVELWGGRGAAIVLQLLEAKKRGEEQERLFVELQVAYDQIWKHQSELVSSKSKLEATNEELEVRLAETFFFHEFFKALTSYLDVGDVCNLIADGVNGMLGAEISCVYLLDSNRKHLLLRGLQGRPRDALCESVDIATRGLLAEVVIGRKMLWDFDARVTERVNWAKNPGQIQSQVAAPLQIQNRILGVVCIGSSIYREMSEAELSRFESICNMGSLALQNALFHAELERLSVTDRLTQLYNHGYFHQRLEEEMSRCQRFGHKLSLLMLDIDSFKDFNDTYGHPKGDLVLKVVAGIMRENMRDMDIAARYGGEEFCAVLPETDLAGAAVVAERIRRQVERQLFVGDGDLPSVRKTVSVGVATFPDNASVQSSLIEKADQALYRAKRAGKNQVGLAGGRAGARKDEPVGA